MSCDLLTSLTSSQGAGVCDGSATVSYIATSFLSLSSCVKNCRKNNMSKLWQTSLQHISCSDLKENFLLSSVSLHTHTHHNIHFMHIDRYHNSWELYFLSEDGTSAHLMRRRQEIHSMVTARANTRQATTSPFLTLLGAVVSHKELS